MTSSGEGHYGRTRAYLRQWMTVAAAAAVKKNIHFARCIGKLMTKKKKEQLKKRKRWWVRPWIARCQQFGAFRALTKEIKVDDPRVCCVTNCPMSKLLAFRFGYYQAGVCFYG